MLENGYVKLYRSMLKWEWYDDVNTKVVFLHLLLTVSIEDSKWHGITVKRGSRVSSYAVLAKETGLSVKQLRPAITHLETTGEVARIKYPKYTVFAINNYDEFQSRAGKTAGKGQGKGRVRAGKGQQYKKVKEDKEDKESFYAASSSTFSCTSAAAAAAAATEEEVKAYADQIGARCDAGEFYRIMQANGWQYRGEPLRDWKAFFRAWEEKDKQRREDNKRSDNAEAYESFIYNMGE